MDKVIISPSILSADFANLESDVKSVEEAGADWLHIDVMDGHFVPNITIGVPVVKSIKKITKLPLDVHLMIDNPKFFVKPFAEAGADIITFHYEACEDNYKDVISYIKSFGIKAGMSIKPKTSHLRVIEDLPESDLDLFLVMTVEPGFGGQEFIHYTSMKIPEIRKNSKPELIIQVDGGINNATSKICTSLGANSLVAGSYIFKNPDRVQAIQSLRN